MGKYDSVTGRDAAEAARFLHLFHVTRPTVVTARYNLFSPLYSVDETDVFTFAHRHNVGVLIKQALDQGLLLGSHHPDAPPMFSASDHRSRAPRFAADSLRLIRERLAPIHHMFGDSSDELARVALRPPARPRRGGPRGLS